jgi:antitoxin (DNA-binding transcriptional repressor) of toxin-antitoxin stability system
MHVNMHEAKTTLSRLVAAVETGEEEVEIARAGSVVARIVLPRERKERKPGLWAGLVRIDRMLVAQAIIENLTLVSVDDKVQSYEVAVLPVA